MFEQARERAGGMVDQRDHPLVIHPPLESSGRQAIAPTPASATTASTSGKFLVDLFGVCSFDRLRV